MPRTATTGTAPVRPASVRTLRAVSAPRTAERGDQPRMSQLAIDTANDGHIINLLHDAQAPARLPRGKAGGRYRCCGCGNQLIFSGPATPGSHFTPRFRHTTARQHPEQLALTAVPEPADDPIPADADPAAPPNVRLSLPRPSHKPAPAPVSRVSLVARCRMLWRRLRRRR